MTRKTVYANLADQCGKSYGIDLNERYLIFGKHSNSGVDSNQTQQSLATVSSCVITLVGPVYTRFNLTFEASNSCKDWPAECTLEITEYAQNNETLRNQLVSIVLLDIIPSNWLLTEIRFLVSLEPAILTVGMSD